MPKLKTHKATASRVKSRKGKFSSRVSGQDHFNARETGKKTRNKRGMKGLAKGNLSNVKRSLPYSN